ncbi:sigma-54-dependent Fis family transcriptional regulator [Streptomyces sp. NBC_00582]|uniref:sigma-54-dependent Fis family transcriptional regulator n=1 Tax=Streptomyces sp. NBC_00582 TaxID=2975783 RepID=UPI003FCC54B4
MTTAERPAVRPALASVRRARELFLMGRQLPSGVPEDVVAGWKRARFFGVRHDAAGPAPGPLPSGSPLLAAARPVLERVAPALDAGRTALLLTDERLRVLWEHGCAPDLLRPDLSEQLVGHNSAALALRTGRRAEVHGPEHFLDVWQEVSAVSVPVRAPGTGRALGTVTVTARLCAECAPHPGAPLAEATASAVEAALPVRARAPEGMLLDAYLRALREEGRGAHREHGRGERAGAVVALDGRNRLVSEAAERLLSPEGLAELERGVVALLATADPARTGAGREPADGPASYRVRLSDGVGCTATLTPLTHLREIVGAVAVLEPAAATSVPPAVARTAVGLAGRSVPWRHAVGRATELTRFEEPLLLVGERGTGKTALARALTPGPMTTVDAAKEELGSWPGELLDGRPLLVRHVERLTQPGTAALNSLLEARPGVPLLITYTPGAPPGPCLQRLLDTLAARTVPLPALRERPEDVRELVTALAPRPAPGQPPLTWTLDALRALERHPWPGNVTELAHLVRALAEHRRATGPVRRAELPDPVREGPAARPLSPMEHAERAAILEALHAHGGNKARTAAALGIARATLYRKLRGYRV